MMRNVLVLGGSRGIDAAIARRFATTGATVAFTYSGSQAAAAALAKEVGAEALRIAPAALVLRGRSDRRDSSQQPAPLPAPAPRPPRSVDCLPRKSLIAERKRERATGVEPATSSLGKLSRPLWGKGFKAAVAELDNAIRIQCLLHFAILLGLRGTSRPMTDRIGPLAKLGTRAKMARQSYYRRSARSVPGPPTPLANTSVPATPIEKIPTGGPLHRVAAELEL